MTDSVGSNPWRRDLGVSRFVTPDEAREWLRSHGKPSALDDPYLSAIHEAGHAVAILLLGGIVKSIDVRLEILTIPGRGEMLGTGYQEDGWPVRETPRGIEWAEGVPEKKMVAWAAGMAAERIVFGPEERQGNLRLEIGQAPAPVTEERAMTLIGLAEELIRPHRAGIEALAKTLLQRVVITDQEEIRRLAGTS